MARVLDSGEKAILCQQTQRCTGGLHDSIQQEGNNIGEESIGHRTVRWAGILIK